MPYRNTTPEEHYVEITGLFGPRKIDITMHVGDWARFIDKLMKVREGGLANFKSGDPEFGEREITIVNNATSNVKIMGGEQNVK